MMRILVMKSIRCYQMCVSPLLPARCRFYPSCSEYGRLAVEKYGVWCGLGLLCRRILRCHPWGGGGYDPVK